MNPKIIIDDLINLAIKISYCSICQDDIYKDDKYIHFCCDQIYHEKCLAEYIGLNMYAKCPICHMWITKEIKEAFDIIFDKEYKLEYYREKIKQTREFTQLDSFYNQNQRSTHILRRNTSPVSPERRPLIPRLDLSSMVPRRPTTSQIDQIPTPPLAPRNSNILRDIQEFYTIMDEYGSRYLTDDDIYNYLNRYRRL